MIFFIAGLLHIMTHLVIITAKIYKIRLVKGQSVKYIVTVLSSDLTFLRQTFKGIQGKLQR